MDSTTCSYEGCENKCGPEAFRITQNERVIGAICPACMLGLQRMKLHFSRPTDFFELEEIVPIPHQAFTS